MTSPDEGNLSDRAVQDQSEGSDEPKRIQLSRAKGWRMPANTVKVDRSTRWGNPFRPGEMKFFCNDADQNDRVVLAPGSVEECVAAFRWLVDQPQRRERIAAELRGKNLGCWCSLDAPCHADVLLELANAPEPSEGTHDGASLKSRAAITTQDPSHD